MIKTRRIICLLSQKNCIQSENNWRYVLFNTI